MIRQGLSICVALAALAAAAGCASTPMVTSYPTGASETIGQFIGEYGLARSMVTVTLTNPEPAGAAQPAANAAAPSVAFSSTINVTTTPAADKKEGAGETEASWCAGLRRTYNQDRLATLAAPTRKSGLEKALEDWIGKPKPGADEVKARVDRIEADTDAILGAVTALDRARLNAPLIEKHCPQPFKITITDSLEIDPNRTYRLYAQADSFSNDRLITEFEGGYLKSISATGDHRATDVLVNAVKTLASIQTYGAKPTISVPRPVAADATWADPMTPAEFSKAIKALVAKIRSDGYNDRNLEELRGLLRSHTPSDPLPPIDVALPIRRTFEIHELANPVVVSRELRVVVLTTCSAIASKETTPTPKKENGILVSAGRSCLIRVPDLSQVAPPTFSRVTATEALNGGAAAFEAGLRTEVADLRFLSRSQFWALDSANSIPLPVDRTAFVRRTTGYTFANGRMTKSDVDRPGEAAEIVALPLKLISAFTGAVAEGIRGETAATQAETARIQAETARIQAQLAYEAARKSADPTTP